MTARLRPPAACVPCVGTASEGSSRSSRPASLKSRTCVGATSSCVPAAAASADAARPPAGSGCSLSRRRFDGVASSSEL